jgi:hypothetical protein
VKAGPAACPRGNLLIEPDNGDVVSFNAGLGYRRGDVLFIEKWLVRDLGSVLSRTNRGDRPPAPPQPRA